MDDYKLPRWADTYSATARMVLASLIEAYPISEYALEGIPGFTPTKGVNWVWRDAYYNPLGRSARMLLDWHAAGVPIERYGKDNRTFTPWHLETCQGFKSMGFAMMFWDLHRDLLPEMASHILAARLGHPKRLWPTKAKAVEISRWLEAETPGYGVIPAGTRRSR